MTLKNLLHSILIVCLMQTQMLTSVAWAQDEGSGGGGAETTAETPDTSPQTNTTRADDSTQENGRKYEEDRNDVDTEEFGLHHIVMITTLIAGTYTAAHCSNLPSGWMVTAASLYWLGTEAQNWEGYDEGSSRDMEAYENDEGEEQIRSLEEAENQTDQAADAIAKRARSTKTAGYAFLAAGATAYLESVFATQSGGKCEGGESAASIFNQNKSQPQLYPSKTDKLFAKHLDQHREEKKFFNSFKINSFTPTYTDQLRRAQSNQELFALVNEYNDYKNNKTSSNHKKVYRHTKKNKLSRKIQKGLITLASFAGDFLLGPKAHAFGGKLAAIGVASGAIYVMFPKTVSQFMQDWTFMEDPVSRGTYLLANGGALLLAADEIKDDADDLQDNADSYKKLADKLRHALRTEGGLNSNVEVAKSELDGDMFGTEDGNNNNQSCMKGNRTKAQVDPNCDCKKTNSCRDSNLQTPEFQGFDTPSALSDTVNSFNETVNSASRGDTEGERIGQEGVANNSNAIRKINDKLQKKINEDRKKEGQKPIDFAKKEEQMRKALPKLARKAYDKFPEKTRQGLAKLSGKTKKAKEDAKKNRDKVKKVVNSVKEGSGEKLKGKDGKKKDPFDGFSFEEEEKNDKDPNAVASKMSEVSLGNGKEVSEKKNGDIFRMISSRYIKSAYPVLFEENKEKGE